MKFDPKLGWCADESKVVAHLRLVAAAFEAAERWIVANTARDATSQMTVNLLCACRGYVHVMVKNIDGHISVLALAARSIYELRLRQEHMYRSSENVDSWQFETIRDFVELCDARLALPESPENKQMRVEIEKTKIEYERILTRHGRRKEGPARAADLASLVGLKVDHAAFFKFMTKIVHPSGYLVNKPEVAGAYENLVLMIWYAQISARHIYEQVKRRYSVPGKWPEPSHEYVGGV